MKAHDDQTQVRIEVQGQEITPVHGLLREGVHTRVHLGTSVQQVLTQDLHIPQERVDQDVQSIFLNGHPVDDMRTLIRAEGSVLTLSAAMPGLVGACMRRDGAYAQLRESISWQEERADEEEVHLGSIRVKLFNLMVPVLGPILLRHGVLVQGHRLRDVLASVQGSGWVSSVQINGQDPRSQVGGAPGELDTEDMLWVQVIPGSWSYVPDNQGESQG